MNQRLVIDRESTPRWARGVRYRRDEARDRWMIVGPERILVPEGPGTDIAALIDGKRSVAEMIAELAAEYDAETATIADETIAFLQQLADQRYLGL